MKVKFFLSIGLAGASRSELVELPDDYSGADIEEEHQAWKNDYLEGYWNKLSEVTGD